jgi:thiamine biosynthesis lipoprotein
VQRSIKSQLTSGAFDISYASMDKIWNLSMTAMPTPEEIKKSAKVGYKKYNLTRK